MSKKIYRDSLAEVSVDMGEGDSYFCEAFKDAKVVVEDTRDYDGIVFIRIYGLNPNAPAYKEDGVMHKGMAGHGLQGDGD